MNFIKQLFTGITDEAYVHSKFVRFSKGEFKRVLLSLRKSKQLKVQASYDFSNELVAIIASLITTPVQVSGIILASEDFRSELPCEAVEYKKKARMYMAQIDAELSPDQLQRIAERFKKSYLLLNIKGSDVFLSCGKSLPKPGKELKPDFCKAILPVEALEEVAFDFPHSFKEAKIEHIYIIEDILIPKEYEDDLAKARVMAKRKGKIVRTIEVDGQREKKMCEFCV